jgi:hypothetical protein
VYLSNIHAIVVHVNFLYTSQVLKIFILILYGIKECYILWGCIYIEGSMRKSFIKRMIEASWSNHHQSENDEVELRKSKRKKMTKTIGPNFFLTYLLENKP